MELRHLKYFLAVAEELNFTRAARTLNISQPPLTKQIKNLEEELGVLLFNRTKHKVVLTPAGKVFLKRTRETLYNAARAVDDARNIAFGISDNITMAFMSSVMLAEFPPFLREFHQAYPNVSIKFVQMRSDEQLEALLEGRIDVGFVDLGINTMSERLKSDSICADLLLHERLYAAVPKGHHLEHRDKIPFAALKNDKFAILERHLFPSNYDTVISACQKAGFSPEITNHGDQIPTVLAYVASNMGVCLAPECSIDAWSKHISYIPLEEVFYVDIHMISKEENTSPGIKELREIVRSLYQDKFS